MIKRIRLLVFKLLLALMTLSQSAELCVHAAIRAITVIISVKKLMRLGSHKYSSSFNSGKALISFGEFDKSVHIWARGGIFLELNSAEGSRHTLWKLSHPKGNFLRGIDWHRWFFAPTPPYPPKLGVLGKKNRLFCYRLRFEYFAEQLGGGVWGAVRAAHISL